MPINVRRLLEVTFAEAEPFVKATILDTSEADHWQLEVEPDRMRLPPEAHERKVLVDVYYEKAAEILSFVITTQFLGKKSVEDLRHVANELNLRYEVLSRTIVRGDRPILIGTVLSVNAIYLDPDKVTGFEIPMKSDIERLIGEAAVNRAYFMEFFGIAG